MDGPAGPAGGARPTGSAKPLTGFKSGPGNPAEFWAGPGRVARASLPHWYSERAGDAAARRRRRRRRRRRADIVAVAEGRAAADGPSHLQELPLCGCA